MSFQSVHICAALVFHRPALSGTALPKNQVYPIFSFSLSWSVAFTNWGGFLGTQQHFSEGMKAPIYNLLHVCNYPDHQRWEKNINPQTFVGPRLKWSHAFPKPRASGLHGSVCELAVMAHLPVSDIILNLSGLPSVKAMSFEPQSSPSCESESGPALVQGLCVHPGQPPFAGLMPVDFLAGSLCYKVLQNGDKPWSLETVRVKKPVSCSSLNKPSLVTTRFPRGNLSCYMQTPNGGAATQSISVHSSRACSSLAFLFCYYSYISLW